MAADQAKTKSVPMRTCIVTREKLPKRDLVRLVRVTNEQGGFEVIVDVYNKRDGRGANIKPDLAVFELALSKGILAKALQLNRQFSEEEKEALRLDFAAALEEREFRPKNQKVRLKISRREFKEKLAN
jgi:predicted RNA-binding protein YlxR (DUF448 family)